MGRRARSKDRVVGEIAREHRGKDRSQASFLPHWPNGGWSADDDNGSVRFLHPRLRLIWKRADSASGAVRQAEI
jgi:hypothetical protein